MAAGEDGGHQAGLETKNRGIEQKKQSPANAGPCAQTPIRIATPRIGGHLSVDLKPDAEAERVQDDCIHISKFLQPLSQVFG